MILIGQFDSPFVRRVGIALTLYDMPFEHRPWSAFGESDKIRRYNPLTRVPTLVLDDDTALIESHIILDYLDNQMPMERRLFPVTEPTRHRALRIAALATGLAEKAVSLFYEKRLHTVLSEVWVERCRTQISSVLSLLESERAERQSEYWFGKQLGHADIAVAVVLRFINDAHPGLVSWEDFPTLSRLSAKLEATPVFRAVSQEFIAPA